MHIRTVLALVSIAIAVATIFAGCAPRQAQPETADSYLKASEKNIEAWQQMRFGMFIHWGPVSLKGTEIGWSRGGERRGRNGTGSIPAEIYDNLYKDFNPVEFDAKEWAAIAKDAGMKYMVFTSKHHDGFSMFDTQFSDYKITNSPFKRDVVRELADACHEQGLKLGYYYSPVDWHHGNYRTENHARYIEFMHNQLREICTNYGKIDIIWFDGLGGTAEDWDSHNLLKMIRELQPGIIINNRAGLPADHDTPEQHVGAFNRERPWETCMTICRQWAWKPNDNMKSLEQCIQTLVCVAGGDGNFLFNVGPMPDGRIEARQVERLEEMGDWLDKYGQTIYSTRGGPFKPGAWGASTHTGKTIYVHVFDWPDDSIILPPINAGIRTAHALTGGTATVVQTDQSTEISVKGRDPNEIDTIIALKLDKSASELEPADLPSLSLATRKSANASNTYQNNASYGPEKAFDDDTATRWATDYGVKDTWLQVDLGEPLTFDRVKIIESYDRVRKFALERQEGDRWLPFLEGEKIGSRYTRKFEPVTARRIRLHITDSADGPTINEFQLIAPKKK